MTTIGRRAAGAARVGGSAVLGVVTVAVVLMGFLHVVGSAEIDPVWETISDYVAVPGGYTLLGVSALALAVAGSLLAAGIGTAGLPRFRPVSGMLGVWSLAFVVVAVFPTNQPGTPVDVSAWVHRIAGAVAFTILPFIVGLVAARARYAAHWAGSARGLWFWSGATGALTFVFLLNQVPVAFGSAPVLPGIGLVQRVLFATTATLLVVLARAVRAASESAAGPVANGGVARRRAAAECGGQV